MIDVTFQLIVFFALVLKIADRTSIRMDLPQPEDPASMLAPEQRKAVVNVIHAPGGQAAGYSIGERTFAPDPEGLEQLRNQLASLYRANAELMVVLRADRETRYAFVQPAIQAVAEAAASVEGASIVPRVSLAITRELGR